MHQCGWCPAATANPNCCKGHAFFHTAGSLDFHSALQTLRSWKNSWISIWNSIALLIQAAPMSVININWLTNYTSSLRVVLCIINGVLLHGYICSGRWHKYMYAKYQPRRTKIVQWVVCVAFSHNVMQISLIWRYQYCTVNMAYIGRQGNPVMTGSQWNLNQGWMHSCSNK